MGGQHQPVIEQIRGAGITTLDGIARELNNRNIRTSRGGQWHPTSVARLQKMSE